MCPSVPRRQVRCRQTLPQLSTHCTVAGTRAEGAGNRPAGGEACSAPPVTAETTSHDLKILLHFFITTFSYFIFTYVQVEFYMISLYSNLGFQAHSL